MRSVKAGSVIAVAASLAVLHCGGRPSSAPAVVRSVAIARLIALSDSLALAWDPQRRALLAFSIPEGRQVSSIKTEVDILEALYDPQKREFWGSGFNPSTSRPVVWSWSSGDSTLRLRPVNGRYVVGAHASTTGERFISYSRSDAPGNHDIEVARWNAGDEISDVFFAPGTEDSELEFIGAEGPVEGRGSHLLDFERHRIFVPTFPGVTLSGIWLESRIGADRWLFADEAGCSVWRSEDGGASFSRLRGLPGCGRALKILRLSSDPFRTPIVFALVRRDEPSVVRELWISRDGGSNWDRAPGLDEDGPWTADRELRGPFFTPRGVWMQDAERQKLLTPDWQIRVVSVGPDGIGKSVILACPTSISAGPGGYLRRSQAAAKASTARAPMNPRT